MASEINVHLFGSLLKIMGRKSNRMMKIQLDGPTPLPGVLSRYKIPIEKIQLVMLNHKATPLDVMVRPGDRLAIFPKEYPFFADWRDFRNPSTL